MNLTLVCMFIRGTADNWYAFPFLIACVIVSIGARYWRFFVQWLNGIQGENWSTISATIDIVSVAKQVESTGRGGEIVSYLATFTYFYRNPELQTGDYSKLFDVEEDATTWTNSCKGSAVIVHIDPRDPSRSVLLKKDL